MLRLQVWIDDVLFPVHRVDDDASKACWSALGDPMDVQALPNRCRFYLVSSHSFTRGTLVLWKLGGWWFLCRCCFWVLANSQAMMKWRPIDEHVQKEYNGLKSWQFGVEVNGTSAMKVSNITTISVAG